MDIILGKKSINWSAVNESIESSINWTKVVEIVKEIIPMKIIEKIKRDITPAQLNQYKSLVNFLFEKLDYSNKRDVNYLSFWGASPITKRPTINPIYKTETDTSGGTNSDNILLLIGIVIWIIIIATNWGGDLEGSPLFLIAVAWFLYFSWKTPYIIIKKISNGLK